jgi:hypothetical protein
MPCHSRWPIPICSRQSAAHSDERHAPGPGWWRAEWQDWTNFRLLNDCLPNLGRHLIITEVANICGNFSKVKSYAYILTKNGLGYILGEFYHICTHLITLVAMSSFTAKCLKELWVIFYHVGRFFKQKRRFLLCEALSRNHFVTPPPKKNRSCRTPWSFLQEIQICLL